MRVRTRKMASRGLENNSVEAAIAKLRAVGEERVDPVRFRFIEALAERSAGQPSAVQAVLAHKLARALAGPLAAGRVTLDNGRIGISGSFLFELGSAQLQPEGRELLNSLAPPLAAYLATRRELLMVSGFTDDRSVRDGRAPFADNLELSAQRAMTVTRALIDEGLPSASVFAAAFGQQQPVASNADAAGRARNRRVEMSPVPRAGAGAGAGTDAKDGLQRP